LRELLDEPEEVRDGWILAAEGLGRRVECPQEFFLRRRNVRSRGLSD